MGVLELLGLVGVAVLLIAYGLSVGGRLAPGQPMALSLNFVGASLILLSLWKDFNLSAALIEAAWALIALFGLIRIALNKRSS